MKKCILSDSEYADLIKDGSTPLLSLESCVNKELNKFQGLNSYSLSEEDNCKDKHFTLLSEAFNDPLTKIYLPCFTSFIRRFDQKIPSERRAINLSVV